MGTSLRAVTWGFFLVDALFRLSWVIWVPTFMIYLGLLFDGDTGKSTLVVAAVYFFIFFLEITFGALADTISGIKAFAWSAAFTSFSYLLYATVLYWDPIYRLWLVIGIELMGALGFAMFSGSFEKWYQTTLELAGYTGSSTEMFGRLKAVRFGVAAVGGAWGIFLYYRFEDVFRVTPTEELPVAALWLPHTWAVILGALALVIALSLRRSLARDDLVLAGGLQERDQRSSRRLVETVRQIIEIVPQGWRILMSTRPLRGGIYLSAASQLTLTVISFYVPLWLWLGQKERDPVLLAGYWVSIHLLRVVGAYLAAPTAARMRRRSGELGVLITIATGVGFAVVAGLDRLDLLYWTLGGLCCITLLLGVVEPYVDGVFGGYAPPDLRALMGSFRSMFGAAFCMVALVPMGLTALWYGNDGDLSFEVFFASTGVLIASTGVYAGATLLRPFRSRDAIANEATEAE